MAATLSLEPLLHALPSLSADKTEQDHDGVDGNDSAPDRHSLAARLQRLWQERGDFSKLSIEKLKAEDEEVKAEQLHQVKKNADQPAPDEDEKNDDSEDSKAERAEEVQSMTQEQLWELKLGILQGLECVLLVSTMITPEVQLVLTCLKCTQSCTKRRNFSTGSPAITSQSTQCSFAACPGRGPRSAIRQHVLKHPSYTSATTSRCYTPSEYSSFTCNQDEGYRYSQ